MLSIIFDPILAIRTTEVDYFRVSVEVEGSESQVLMSVPWHRVNIKVFMIIVWLKNMFSKF